MKNDTFSCHTSQGKKPNFLAIIKKIWLTTLPSNKWTWGKKIKMLRKSMEMFLLYFFSWFCIYFLKRKTNINMKKCCLGYSKTFCLNWTEQKFYAKFQHAPNKKKTHLQSGHYDFLNGIFFCTWNQKSQRGSMRYL